MAFFDRLENRITSVDSLLCVGLDPHPNQLKAWSAASVRSFCQQLIDATYSYAAAYKPNAAFFEALGAEGLAALEEIIAYIPDDIPVILDAKRGDISSTAQAYAEAAFEVLGADCMTINPYLGYDAVEPFISDPVNGVFMLCKTSNPGAGDFQDLGVIGEDNPEGVRLYEHVATLAQKWNKHNNLGLVVGATQIESLARVRTAAPDLWILAPGVGAQGGDLAKALQAGLRKDGMGMLIPVSRGISRAENPKQTAKDLRDEINRQRQRIGKYGDESDGDAHLPEPGGRKVGTWPVADGLLAAGCVKFGTFTLKSGIESPFYIDLRRLAGFPSVLRSVADAFMEILRALEFDQIGALPYAAMPIGTAISLQGGWPMVYPRKETKTYGTKVQVEGVYEAGERVVVIDDLISTGGSKIEGIKKLEQVNLAVQDIVVLIDRRSDRSETGLEGGYRLHSVLTISDLLDYYEATGAVPTDKITVVREFLGE